MFAKLTLLSITKVSIYNFLGPLTQYLIDFGSHFVRHFESANVSMLKTERFLGAFITYYSSTIYFTPLQLKL